LTPLEILYLDEHYVAIHKPHGLMVHKSGIARDVTEFALQRLRDQLNQHVFPCHRLDRKTSGVLLFALSKEAHKLMSAEFHERKVSKVYNAIVRGFTEDEARIDYALTSESGAIQDAVTDYETLKRFEIDLPFGNHSTSRYSFIQVTPETGRMHQIRKHMAHVFHPILGDRPHGCNKQNKLWKENFNMIHMMLHASELNFTHPFTKGKVEITAPYSE